MNKFLIRVFFICGVLSTAYGMEVLLVPTHDEVVRAKEARTKLFDAEKANLDQQLFYALEAAKPSCPHVRRTGNDTLLAIKKLLDQGADPCLNYNRYHESMYGPRQSMRPSKFKNVNYFFIHYAPPFIVVPKPVDLGLWILFNEPVHNLLLAYQDV